MRFSILERIRKRFSIAAWISLLILLTTGMLQLIANPNYQGVLHLINRWSMVILLKHLAVVGMVAVAAFQTWIIQPRLI
jgi:putative copper export protein